MVDALGMLLVASGACGGAVVRFGVHELGKAHSAGPLSICAVNICGSFIFGMVSASATPEAQLALGTGFCGALTTFSTYSMDTVRMLQKQEFVKAACYVTASNVLSIASAGAGYTAGVCVQRSPRTRWISTKLPFQAALLRPPAPAKPPTRGGGV